jgi:hypothetical protein
MSASPDPARRSLAGKIAANSRWSEVEDRPAATAAARNAFLSKFETQVDPEGTLPPEERARRAESARKAHFQRLALASAKARSRNSKDRHALAAELRAAAAELEAGGASA